MNAYIPTTETVRAHYAESLSWDTDGKEEQDGKWEAATYQFDRWHQAELRKAKAAGWDEGFDAGWDEREDFALCGAIPSGKHQSVVTNPYRDQIEEEL